MFKFNFDLNESNADEETSNTTNTTDPTRVQEESVGLLTHTHTHNHTHTHRCSAICVETSSFQEISQLHMHRAHRDVARLSSVAAA